MSKSPDRFGSSILAVMLCLLATFASSLGSGSCHAAELDDAIEAFNHGRYAEATRIASERVEQGVWLERWPVLLIECQLTTGKYADALQTYRDAITRYSSSIVLRRLGLDVLRLNGLLEDADVAELQLQAVLQRSLLGYISRDNMVAAGRYLADKGEDARKILELFYDRVRDRDPDYLEAYLATAELAIEKGDDSVAAKTLSDAAKLGESDPRIDWLLAKSLLSSDLAAAIEALNRALKINPRLPQAQQMLAELAIDGERYDEAEDAITEMLKVNLHDQKAWALLAVLAHIRGDYEIEKLMRAAALSTWEKNPHVDHLIGKKLSRKYRFAEAAEYQNRALEMEPKYSAAILALSQDLLRLGDEAVGWELANEVVELDPYNVVAYNLLTLKDEIDGYVILEQDGIRVRMERVEANVYGEVVLKLLSEAKATLCEKYKVNLTNTISVEIYPRQSDFAIRTFGLPGGAGYLGVCFGRVITANSPASQGERPANWRSVLWHELCHTVTLEKTRNRMPRWLSEGISVYEERLRDPTWGESMTPTYRQMLLNEQRTPVSDLSASFLNPASPMHLQFAYYHSSLVIEFIVDRYSMDALLAILDDLAAGLLINDALTRHVGSLAKLDQQFDEFAIEVANDLGPVMKWDREDLPESTDLATWRGWLRMHPTNYWGLRRHAELAIAKKEFAEAKRSLQTIELLGGMTNERNGPMEWMATIEQEIGDKESRRQVLSGILRRSSDALALMTDMIAMDLEEERWESVVDLADQAIGVQPLRIELHDAMATAAMKSGQPDRAIAALESMTALKPLDPIAHDYRLAQAHHLAGEESAAKRHVLRALEQAPRYRDALQLLLEIVQADGVPAANAPTQNEEKVEP
ncbi:tetratricopeptide repeat protein [Neorhodopirellula pilleata]|uniref:Tetratricopeptide repeat protein n=1 Tax=Neorhodopirellula pilleata TaxID=2714738 RepID=A0A5C6A2Y5_9BACT|nr:tetratricopeptide repeat protein [Neorhodopirellula pilleata]TWT94274.1 Tetratricopeptide repeat protein [Neorhodopirellula pilleata]